MLNWVYVGLGGNIGDTYAILGTALEKIRKLPSVQSVEVSSFYLTDPVSDLSQDCFLNAACRFRTDWDAQTLFAELEKIETALGKVPKPKNAPRIIDLDLLFYKQEQIVTKNLEIPHPRWRERLFVLAPLAELTRYAGVPPIDLYACLENVNIQKHGVVEYAHCCY